jgi:hypothetical protein
VKEPPFDTKFFTPEYKPMWSTLSISTIRKMAPSRDRVKYFGRTLTGDMGCEHGGGVSCAGDSANGNTGAPGSVVPGFTPDLVRDENRLNLAILVKF